MAGLRTVVFLALLCAVALAVEQEVQQPPRDGANDLNAPQDLEDRKFYKPYFFHPHYPHHPYHTPETPAEEAIDATEVLEDQELTDSDNAKVDEEEQESEEVVPLDDASRMESRDSYAVSCDFLSVPKYSCYSCFTYLTCKPEGGKVKSCSKPNAPYCNNGICSASPSAECKQNLSALFY